MFPLVENRQTTRNSACSIDPLRLKSIGPRLIVFAQRELDAASRPKFEPSQGHPQELKALPGVDFLEVRVMASEPLIDVTNTQSNSSRSDAAKASVPDRGNG